MRESPIIVKRLNARGAIIRVVKGFGAITHDSPALCLFFDRWKNHIRIRDNGPKIRYVKGFGI